MVFDVHMRQVTASLKIQTSLIESLKYLLTICSVNPSPPKM